MRIELELKILKSKKKISLIALSLVSLMLVSGAMGAVLFSRQVGSTINVVYSRDLQMFSNTACTTTLTSFSYGDVAPNTVKVYGSTDPSIYGKNPTTAQGAINVTWHVTGLPSWLTLTLKGGGGSFGVALQNWDLGTEGCVLAVGDKFYCEVTLTVASNAPEGSALNAGTLVFDCTQA